MTLSLSSQPTSLSLSRKLSHRRRQFSSETGSSFPLEWTKNSNKGSITFNKDPQMGTYPYPLIVDLALDVGNYEIYKGDFISKSRLVPSRVRIHSKEDLSPAEVSTQLLELPTCSSQIDPNDNVQIILLGTAYLPTSETTIQTEAPFGDREKFHGVATIVTPNFVFCLFANIDHDELMDNFKDASPVCQVWPRKVFFHHLANNGLQSTSGGAIKYTTRPLHFRTIPPKVPTVGTCGTAGETSVLTCIYPLQISPLHLGTDPGDVFSEISDPDFYDDWFDTFLTPYDGWNKDELPHSDGEIQRLGNNEFLFPMIDGGQVRDKYKFTILRFTDNHFWMPHRYAHEKITTFFVPYSSSEVEKHLLNIKESTLILPLWTESDFT